MIGVTPNITETTRLGKPNPQKPRVLRVTVDSFEDKRTILSKATNLRKLPKGHDYELVYIKPNLTPQQQEASKNLYLQLVAVRKKNPTIKYKISRGKIITVSTPEPPQA